MTIHASFKSLTSIPTRRRPIRRRHPASRLCLEALEDRCLLTLSPSVNYAVGSYPYAVVTGDFNNDAILDIASVNPASSTVSVLLGLGDGTFQPARDSAAGVSSSTLVVGDFNGDGDLDLVTTHYTNPQPSVIRG